MAMRVRLAAIVCLMASGGLAEAQSRFPFFEPVTPPRQVQIVARHGVANVAPENTAQAIAACAVDFIEWAEVEVRLTEDGQHVILRDATLDRTTNGKGAVAEITAEAFVKLDAGTWYAPRFEGTHPLTLRELLRTAKGKVNLNLDCRAVHPERLVREIVESGMASQVAVAAALSVLAEIRAAGKGTIATIARFDPAREDFDQFVSKVDPAAVSVAFDSVTAELCRRFHERGIRVRADLHGTNRDNRETWGHMFEAEVDWLVTDNPAAARFAAVRRRIETFPVRIAHHRGTNGDRDCRCAGRRLHRDRHSHDERRPFRADSRRIARSDD
jgi:glycerophosphoryl diester phosphodiesterase